MSEAVTLANGILRTLCALNALFFVLYILHQPTLVPILSQILFVCLAFGCWNFFLGLFYLSPNETAWPVLNSLALVATSFSVYAFFMSIFSSFENNKKPPLWLLMALGFVPLVTTVLALLNSPSLIRYVGGINPINPLRELNVQYGAWFFVHSAYSLSLLIVALGLIVVKLFSKDLSGNRSIFFVLLVLNVWLLADHILAKWVFDKDFGVSTVFVHFLMINTFFCSFRFDKSLLLSYLAREKAENNHWRLDFIFDTEDRFVDKLNQQAKGTTPYSSFKKGSSLQENFEKMSVAYLIEPFVEGINTVFYLQENKENGSVYYCVKQPLALKGRHVLGYSVSVVNIKALGKLLVGLQDIAYWDSLSASKSRVAFEQNQLHLIQEATAEHNFFVVCDVDSLKRVNDTFGHTQGDNYLVDCSQLLHWEFNEIGDIYRIGGDEFFIYVKGVTDDQLNEIVKRIHAESFDLQEGLKTGISVGWVQVESEVAQSDEQWDALFRKYFEIADQRMYQDKCARKHERAACS